MSTDLPPWPRPRFEAGGQDAFLFFAVYGRFSKDVELSGTEYRTAGAPPGIGLRKLNRTQSPQFPFSSETVGSSLHPPQPGLFAEIQTVPECMILQGVVPDPSDLNYLRDTVGLVMYFLDHGGIAVVDPQQFKLYAPTAWRSEIFAPASPNLSEHVLILVTDEDKTPGKKWMRTRGLRKFGRPDLSFHNVQPEHESAVVELLNNAILLQAQGALIPDGAEIRVPALPSAVRHRASGSPDDADFYNVRLEIDWVENR